MFFKGSRGVALTLSVELTAWHSSASSGSREGRALKLIQSAAICLAVVGPCIRASCHWPCNLAKPHQKKRLRSASCKNFLSFLLLMDRQPAAVEPKGGGLVIANAEALVPIFCSMYTGCVGYHNY